MMAEEEGFEPSHRVTSLRAFQARPFSLLGIPPYEAQAERLLVMCDSYYIKNHSLIKEKKLFVSIILFVPFDFE